MTGKISTVMRVSASTPRIMISMQKTAMVYGRRSASRTNHILNR